MSELSPNPHNPPDAEKPGGLDLVQEELTLLDLVIMLAKHKWLVIGLPVLFAVVTAAASFLMTDIYTASTKVLPPQQSQSTASAMLGQLGVLAGATGAAFGIKNPNDVYVAMLKSRTVADNLIQRFDLDKRYEQNLRSGTRAKLDGNVKIAAGKDGIIEIEVEDAEPSFAAQLANAYVEELVKLTRILAVTEASQRRLFFEQQFLQAKENLAKAEVTARQALERGGLVKVDEQGRAMVEASARLRAQIAVKEVQIGAMRAFAADRNPDLRMAQQELDAIKLELSKVEGVGGARTGDGLLGTKGVENLRLLRDLKYYETIYELLARQYEIAKIDEAKESSIIQVLDKAVVPDRKSRPKRRQMVILSIVIAGFLAVIIAIMRESAARARRDPRTAERLKVLRRYVLGRRGT